MRAEVIGRDSRGGLIIYTGVWYLAEGEWYTVDANYAVSK